MVLQFPVLEAAVLGATVSVRLNSGVGGECSIFNLANLGSSTSLNSSARLGSSVSVDAGAVVESHLSTSGKIAIQQTLSERDVANLCSSLTIGRANSIGGVTHVSNNLLY